MAYKTLTFEAVADDGSKSPRQLASKPGDVHSALGRLMLEYGTPITKLNFFDGDKLIGFVGITDGHDALFDVKHLMQA